MRRCFFFAAASSDALPRERRANIGMADFASMEDAAPLMLRGIKISRYIS